MDLAVLRPTFCCDVLLILCLAIHQAVSSGDWTFLAMVYTGSEVKLYINGQIVDSKSSVTGKQEKDPGEEMSVREREKQIKRGKRERKREREREREIEREIETCGR